MIFLFALALLAAGNGNTADWRTDYEKSNYLDTPRYEATVAYCQRLAEASPWVQYGEYGESGQGRALPMLVVDRGGHFDPASARAAGNIILFVQAGIHSGEIDGKDAGMMLVRDIAIDRTLEKLLDHVTLVFLPIFNVDGHERFGRYNRINQDGPREMGWRVTARNLNLNRDYLKSDTPEMVSWLGLYTRWLPEFFVDCHVTDGADYQYVVTYALETAGNMDAGLTQWTLDRYEVPLARAMAKRGFPVQRYCAFRNEHDPRSGMLSGASPPRFSTGYTAIQNRPGLLIETHMLKNYKARVTGTYETLRATMEILNAEGPALRDLCAAADARAASVEFRRVPFPLAFEVTADSTMIDFLGIDYTVEKSALTGGDWYRYGNRKVTWKIPYFNRQRPSATAMLPAAYILPPEWDDIVARLQLHGIQVQRTTKPCTVDVTSYRLSAPRWEKTPFEGRVMMTCTPVPVIETRAYPAGSTVIDMNQRSARTIAHALKPAAPDSYARWGFFNEVTETKEYVESYVAEEMARKMLAETPELRHQLDDALAADSTLAKDPDRIRWWFYDRSPWRDDHIGRYPVGGIATRDDVRRVLR